MHSNTAILLLSCPDRKGLVSEITQFIHNNKGNIVHVDEHVDLSTSTFFMRIEWTLESFLIKRDQLEEAIERFASSYDMDAKLYYSDAPVRLALFVSKDSHCLYDILARHEAGGLPNVEIPLIVSNHPDLQHVADRFNIPYHLFPITKDTKAEQEQKEIALLRKHQVETVILARYMQILSDDFISEFPHNVINIHHSFLPAFMGARPYHQAFKRGVKIVGATSHYATLDLDEGPIIEQDVIHVTHRDNVKDLIRKGSDLEKVVLSRALWWHTQRKVLAKDNKTIIFR